MTNPLVQIARKKLDEFPKLWLKGNAAPFPVAHEDVSPMVARGGNC